MSHRVGSPTRNLMSRHAGNPTSSLVSNLMPRHMRLRMRNTVTRLVAPLPRLLPTRITRTMTTRIDAFRGKAATLQAQREQLCQFLTNIASPDNGRVTLSG